MPTCTDCGGTVIEYDTAAGNGFCVKCGTVVEENTIVSEVVFGETSSGAAMVQGSYVAQGASHARMSGPYGNRGSGESREQTIANATRKIQSIANILRLSEVVCLSATRLYTLAVEHKFTKGRKSLNVVAVCLYVACRQKETRNYMLIDFSDLLQVNVFELGHTYLQLIQTLNLRLPLVDPSHYISRFAALLEFGDETHRVATDAIRLVQRFDRDWMTRGRRPAGICGAALLLAARMNNFRRSVEEIVQVVKIADTTLKKRLDEFKNTPSGSLTLADFRSVWLEEEVDPPAFTKGREKEEAEKEAQREKEAAGSEDESDSGTEARKRKGKGKQKKKKKGKEKRKEKGKEKTGDEEQEKEKEREKKRKGKRKREDDEDNAEDLDQDAEGDVDEDVHNESEAGPSTAAARRPLDPAIFNDSESILAGAIDSTPLFLPELEPEVDDSNIDPALLDKSDEASPFSLGAVSLVLTSPNSLPSIALPSTSASASTSTSSHTDQEPTHPSPDKDSDTDHSDLKHPELVPPPIDPFDETVSTALAEEVNTFLSSVQGAQLTDALNDAEQQRLAEMEEVDELMGLDEDELDRLLLSEEEVKIKERVWVELNRDYLEALAAKGDSEQSSSNKRKRRKTSHNNKPRDTSTAHGATAAESVKNLLKKNHRYSKRINYAALQDLFVDGPGGGPTPNIDDKTDEPLYTMDDDKDDGDGEGEGMVVIEEAGVVGVNPNPHTNGVGVNGSSKSNGNGNASRSTVPMDEDDGDGEDEDAEDEKDDGLEWDEGYEQEV